MLETGSNVNFIISAEDPAILLETDYTQYFQAYYDNWRDTIITFANDVNELGIHNCYLSKHEIIGTANSYVSRVTYTDKTNPSKQVVLVVNVRETAVDYNGITVPGYGFIIEK